MTKTVQASLVVSILLGSAPAFAQDAVPPPVEPPKVDASASASAPKNPASPPPSTYSLPWQLRPVTPVTVVRLDTVMAPSDVGTSTVMGLTGSYKLTPNFAVLAKVAAVQNAPSVGSGATSFINPVIGAQYGLALSKDFKASASLGVTAPVGMGGGASPDKDAAGANKAGGLARASMDGAMFAVNDLGVAPGFDIAYNAHNLTVQVEATVIQLMRTRGEAVQPDASKTNLTSGLHVGYFVLPSLSVGAEARYQTWLSTPAAVAKDSSQRDTMSFAAGVRGHFKVSEKAWFRPGVSYGQGIFGPLATAGVHVAQLDLPMAF